ncbi:MAG: putative selenium-dependent hydroxylase accessory protein YqeC [Spirochaetaceae bacterium]|nr:putative selenium-dependent hydroxylase accessory protein YqeC [Spirochaetaceae bacterium]
METLSAWFGDVVFGGADSGPAVITVIGSGGKTSLIWLLANRLARRSLRVLVTPATKMFPPAPAEHLFDHYCRGTPAVPLEGITLAGIFNEKTGKLESLPLPELEQISAGYDLVLIEGDGSKTLPLKGWADHEPVVPRCTGITVGMIPLRPLGMPASEKIIHRFPLFCALSGVKPGEPLGLAHFAAAIDGAGQASRSLFTAARGRKILFINQIEDEALFARAGELVSLLTPEFRSDLDRVIAGSALRDTAREIRKY